MGYRIQTGQGRAGCMGWENRAYKEHEEEEEWAGMCGEKGVDEVLLLVYESTVTVCCVYLHWVSRAL